MSTSTPRTVVATTRIQTQHAERIREIADRNASTMSRTIARLVERQLDQLAADAGSTDAR